MYFLKSINGLVQEFAPNWAEAVVKGQSLADTYDERFNAYVCGEDLHCWQFYPIGDPEQHERATNPAPRF